MKIYRLKNDELDMIAYGANENCIAAQYIKLINNPDILSKLSPRNLNKYINLIINARTTGIFIGNISNIFLRKNSGFNNYKFINESEICEVL